MVRRVLAVIIPNENIRMRYADHHCFRDPLESLRRRQRKASCPDTTVKGAPRHEAQFGASYHASHTTRYFENPIHRLFQSKDLSDIENRSARETFTPNSWCVTAELHRRGCTGVNPVEGTIHELHTPASKQCVAIAAPGATSHELVGSPTNKKINQPQTTTLREGNLRRVAWGNLRIYTEIHGFGGAEQTLTCPQSASHMRESSLYRTNIGLEANFANYSARGKLKSPLTSQFPALITSTTALNRRKRAVAALKVRRSPAFATSAAAILPVPVSPTLPRLRTPRRAAAAAMKRARREPGRRVERPLTVEETVDALQVEVRGLRGVVDTLLRMYRNAGGLAGIRPSAVGLLYAPRPPLDTSAPLSPAAAAFAARAAAAPTLVPVMPAPETPVPVMPVPVMPATVMPAAAAAAQARTPPVGPSSVRRSAEPSTRAASPVKSTAAPSTTPSPGSSGESTTRKRHSLPPRKPTKRARQSSGKRNRAAAAAPRTVAVPAVVKGDVVVPAEDEAVVVVSADDEADVVAPAEVRADVLVCAEVDATVPKPAELEANEAGPAGVEATVPALAEIDADAADVAADVAADFADVAPFNHDAIDAAPGGVPTQNAVDAAPQDSFAAAPQRFLDGVPHDAALAVEAEEIVILDDVDEVLPDPRMVASRPSQEAIAPESANAGAMSSQPTHAAVTVERDAEMKEAHEGMKTQPAAALAIFKRYADVGDVEAHVACAALLRRGAGSRLPVDQRIERDYAAAVVHLDLALHANPACIPALVARGELARDGLDGPPDETMALALFERAVDAGSAEARVALAKSLVRRVCRVKLTHSASKKMSTRARRLLNEALEMGEGRAAFYIAHMYTCRGDPAYAAVSSAFDSGQVGIHHERAALRMYERAAGMGVAEALNIIGTWYSEGNGGLQPSFERALDCFTRAWEQGSFKAGANAGMLFETGLRGLFPDRVNLSEAVHWYARGVTVGHASSVLHLGQMYDDGTGVAEDKSMAEKCYVKARLINDEADVNERSPRVETDAVNGLTHLYLYQAVIDKEGRLEWNDKLNFLLGEKGAMNRRAHFAAQLASASVGSDAQRFVVLNNQSVDEAKRLLHEWYTVTAVDTLLSAVTSVVHELDKTLIGEGGVEVVSATLPFGNLVDLLGHVQAEKLRDARRMVTVESQQTGNDAVVISSGSDSAATNSGVPRQRLPPKRVPKASDVAQRKKFKKGKQVEGNDKKKKRRASSST